MRGVDHNCSQCEEQINAYLDGAFSVVEEARFKEVVKVCPRCCEKLEKEKNFKVFLKKKLPTVHASSDLISNIRSRIHQDKLR